MESERIPENFLKGRFHNKRLMGKLRTEWEDVVWSDTLQILGIQGRWRRAEDREEWRHLLRDTKAQKGLQCHR
jgi:hypothetical protein